jgi:plastocyanin
MRWFRVFASAASASLTLAACGGGGSVAIGDPPLPSLTATQSPSATPPSSHPRHHHVTTTSATPTPTSGSPSPAGSHPVATTPATHRPSPSHQPAPSPTKTSPCAAVSGATTTIQEQSGYRFAPSTVSIHRCDSVKAVYSDTTGTPHTFTGPGWDSGGMSSTGKTSYTYQFASKGTFNFVCSYHKSFGMTGTITVS